MSDSALTPFHLAIPVHDLALARQFYGQLLGCAEGRSAAQWVDFNFYGHQLVVHLDPGARRSQSHNLVDGDAVPIPHFGVVLRPADWRLLAERLQQAGQTFLLEPHTRFAGQAGEQSTMFFSDPSGNALEFKAFADINRMLFANP